MRRAEKEVKDLEQLEEILRDCNTVRIGTQDAEGMFIVPLPPLGPGGAEGGGVPPGRGGGL